MVPGLYDNLSLSLKAHFLLKTQHLLEIDQNF